MMYRAVVDASGRIERAYGALSVEGLDMNAPRGPFVHDVSGPVRPDTDWWNGTAWASRPVPPAPPALTPDTLVMWTGLPPGCTVTVIDPATGLVPDGGSDVIGPTGALSFMLPAGPWRLEVSEKFPFKAAVFEVEV